MLPASKEGFPKFLYLDQNKWIDLARAHYGLEEGSRFKPALDAVNSAVEAGKLCVPLSAIHVMETMAPYDEARRKRTAEFMVSLSRNLSVLPYSAVRQLEIKHAVMRAFKLTPMSIIRPAIVREGLSYALGAQLEVVGAPSGMEVPLLTLLNSPATSVSLLVDAANRATIADARQDDVEGARILEDIRKRARETMSEEERHRAELAELYSTGAAGAELREALRSLNADVTGLIAAVGGTEGLVHLFHDVPTMDIYVTLSLARDRETQRKIDRNDSKDIAFMAIAIPYANVVVAERYWSHKVAATGLAGKYGTIVMTDAAELPDVLKTAGCLP